MTLNILSLLAVVVRVDMMGQLMEAQQMEIIL
jgi:hypothetical protein